MAVRAASTGLLLGRHCYTMKNALSPYLAGLYGLNIEELNEIIKMVMDGY